MSTGANDQGADPNGGGPTTVLSIPINPSGNPLHPGARNIEYLLANKKKGCRRGRGRSLISTSSENATALQRSLVAGRQKTSSRAPHRSPKVLRRDGRGLAAPVLPWAVRTMLAKIAFPSVVGFMPRHRPCLRPPPGLKAKGLGRRSGRGHQQAAVTPTTTFAFSQRKKGLLKVHSERDQFLHDGSQTVLGRNSAPGRMGARAKKSSSPVSWPAWPTKVRVTRRHPRAEMDKFTRRPSPP